jgi:hypothetical protein
MPYKIAGIDVHKRMLAVVVADVEVQGEYQFEQRQFGGNPEHLRLLAEWLIEQQVEEVVMESTAQYWKPVWGARCRERSIWRKHNRIVEHADARRISPMPNVW